MQDIPVSPEPETQRISPIKAATEQVKVEIKETPSLIRRPVSRVSHAAVSEPTSKAEDNAFTDEQVTEQWEQYKALRQQNGATDTEKLVLSRPLKKLEENNIQIFLESQLEISILEKFEADLIRFFRQSLGNTLIRLEKVISEQESTQNLYTSKEKFEYMAKQNPALRQLKDRLGLDFEY